MASVAAVIDGQSAPTAQEAILAHAGIANIALVVTPGQRAAPAGSHTVLAADHLWSPAAIGKVIDWFRETGDDYLLWSQTATAELYPSGLQRLVDCAQAAQAAIVYSDFCERSDASIQSHPLIDYQTGSLRDDFDFGPLLLIDRARLSSAADPPLRQPAATKYGGWYDLRLRLSEVGPVIHLPEPTYTISMAPQHTAGESHFRYVDPRNRAYQLEMEQIATAHLRRIGAYLAAPQAPLTAVDAEFPVTSSVVIPVKNRRRTVADAVTSALAQTPNFKFNVIVIDNYSDDGTTEILKEIAHRDARLVHLNPQRTDLGIGGCWNEAIYSASCGRFAVQLDSDDLYTSGDVLQRVVDEFQNTGCAMVIGSYTIVDFDLNPLPPGLVDHREWTDGNGHNNALRIAGLGAPRAFHVPTLRQIGFPNVSYGEDYAVALKIAGQHRVGRIYDSLYWCRRWEDNTDHDLPLETINRYAAYKDRIRSIEIAARQQRQT